MSQVSWDDHINGGYLMGSGIMSKAVIASQQGATLCASKENGINNVVLKPEEVLALVRACKGDDSFFTTGVYLDGAKYLMVNRNDNQVNLKASDSVNKVKYTASAIITNQLVIVGVDKDGSAKGALADKVYKCGKYLCQTGC